MTKRLFDVVIAGFLVILLSIPMLVIALSIRLNSPGTALHWSARVGKEGRIFHMPKFRSMDQNTPLLPTEELISPTLYLTSLGSWLRRTSLDELPQLWSVIRGDMSLVGPRPALVSQQRLRELRHASGLDHLLPGITGWAQINGRDQISESEKVAFDAEYNQKRCLRFDLYILGITLVRVLKKENIRH